MSKRRFSLRAVAPTPATALPRYLETLDSSPLEVLPLLAPGFTFSVLWSDEAGAKEFAGGLDELHEYLAQRDPEGHLHHVLGSVRLGRTEFLFGRTTRHGKPLATFVNAADVDEEGRLQNLFGARTTTLELGELPL
jgi:hypothetical protein